MMTFASQIPRLKFRITHICLPGVVGHNKMPGLGFNVLAQSPLYRIWLTVLRPVIFCSRLISLSLNYVVADWYWDHLCTFAPLPLFWPLSRRISVKNQLAAGSSLGSEAPMGMHRQIIHRITCTIHSICDGGRTATPTINAYLPLLEMVVIVPR
ncbi:hypothetical protein EV356DRAFT_309576 [Viridothelium virens]|uniref:Uncharacterized protein n=1 Tax=Viridothelium virens TaxID=1048519 RepID=A0A6A6HKP4_VIRVR|nr:hypothetical protein EV356DRAFT_309576 [Viridothelium virens]